MNIIKYILFFTTLISYGQNVVREGYWYAMQGDKQGVNRTSMAKAQGDTFEFFKQDPNTPIYIIPPTQYRVEFDKSLIANIKEVDTITAIMMKNNGWLDYTNAGTEPLDKPIAYLPFYGIGMIKVDTDSVPNWQTLWKLQRTKEFGKTTYKSIGIPFQFLRDSIVSRTENSVRVRTFGTEKHCVSYFLDNKEYHLDASCNPGQTILDGVNVWRHTKVIEGLEPSSDYILRVEGVTDNGDINYTELKIKTL